MFLDREKTAKLLFVLAVFFLVIDRFLKIVAINSIKEYSLLADILKFSFAKNYYIAFSLPFGGEILIIFIITIILALMLYFFTLLKKSEYLEASLFFNVLLGASSNLFDRFRYGYVVDYIDLRYFTVFNVADAMIVGAVISLLFITWNKELFIKR